MVRRLVPISTSIKPVWVMAPERAKTLVPLLVAVPMAPYQAPPCRKIAGTAAKVSTLLIKVGRPHKPDTAG